MKRIITAVAALLFSVAIFAQSNASQTPDQRAKRETDQINALVPLGDAYQKVLDVNKQDAAQRETITKGAKRSELTDDQKAQLKTFMQTHRTNLKTAMGADLYAKYVAAEKAKRESGGGGRQGGGE
jgi:Spy/CpxP family protein refolding chaperone